jgi:hypothetical protein
MIDNNRWEHGVFSDVSSDSTRLKMISSAVFLSLAPALSWAGEQAWPSAVLAPSGFTAAINTPTADVVPWGGAALGITNSNPEITRTIDAGSFGSLNAGFGLLPGLELVGRLAYEGQVNCSSYNDLCLAGQRDLSLSGKYQLPFILPLDTRVALGFTDYGGAATNYRQFYGVATSTWGPLDLSLGYSRPRSTSALMDGPFGSVVLRLTDHWSAALEHDTQEARMGLHYQRPLTRDLALQLGASRKLTDATGQQPWQMSAALNIMLGGNTPDPLREARRAAANPSRQPATQPAAPYRTAASTAPASTAGASTAASASQAAAAEQPQAASPAGVAQASRAGVAEVRHDYQPVGVKPLDTPPATTPEAMASALRKMGFNQVQVRYWPATQDQPALWQINAEPRRWRQSQVDAMARGLATWLGLQGKGNDGSRPADELLLSLTWQREPVLHAYTSAACLDGWMKGWTRCALGDSSGLAYGRALELNRELAGMGRRLASVKTRLQQPPQTVAREQGEPSWMPQFEIGPNLRYAVGTEVGLLDYSAALEVGAEVSLADVVPGLFWQGVMSVPVAHSDDYDDRQVYAAQRHPEAGVDSGLLSWWKPLPMGLAGQVSAGYIDRDYRGALGDTVWMSQDGRWRLSAMAGSFRHEVTGVNQSPVLGTARWSLAPGAWQLEATAGRFLNGDRGYRISSNHWFGDTLFRLYYRDSEGDAGTTVGAQRKFLGFSFSLPLGPKQAYAAGPVTVRGTDRFALGLETKVGEDDNKLTYGYGAIPRVRHGLQTDVTDFDRNGQADLLAQYSRLRVVMTEQLAQRR